MRESEKIPTQVKHDAVAGDLKAFLCLTAFLCFAAFLSRISPASPTTLSFGLQLVATDFFPSGPL